MLFIHVFIYIIVLYCDYFFLLIDSHDHLSMTSGPTCRGWALVEGPGFGLRGPCLIDPDANDGASQMIHIRRKGKLKGVS